MRPLKFHYFIILLSLFILTMGCKNDEEKPIWEHKKAVDFFTEAQLIEAELIIQKNNPKKDSIATAYYDELFNKFNTNQTEFDSMLSFYSRHPNEMDTLYGDVITRLTLLQSVQQSENKK